MPPVRSSLQYCTWKYRILLIMCHSNLFISLVVKLPPIKLRSGVAGPRRKKRNGSCVAGFLPVPPGNPARAPRCMKCIYVMCSNPRYCVQFKYLIRFNDTLLGWRESGAKRRRCTPPRNPSSILFVVVLFLCFVHLHQFGIVKSERLKIVSAQI